MKHNFSVYKFLTIIPLLLAFWVTTGFSSETKINEKVTGIWVGPGEYDSWPYRGHAAWIWAGEELEAKAVFFRKTFNYNNLKWKAFLRITASSQYQLYVNGEYVCRGPARCAPHHQLYDVLNITGLLNEGENLIAVRVHHQDGKRSYQYKGRAGLLALLTIGNGETTMMLGSDTRWKVLPDPAWDKKAPLISRFQQVVNDRVDFRKYPKGWETMEFDDRSWQQATELMRKNGWPSPQKNARAQRLTPPWTSLVPRDIPYLIEKDNPAENLIEAIQIDTPLTEKPHQVLNEIQLQKNTNGWMEIPESGSNSWLLMYDFGKVINGMPQLDIQGSAGTEVEIITAPFMVGKRFTHITVDSEFRDKIILSGKRDKWEATYFKPTRFLGIIVKNRELLTLFSAGIHQIKYPFERKGFIESDDAPWVKKYMDASAKTINVCTTDAFTDNYRERRQYAQTGFYAALGNYYTFGDWALQRRYLIQVAQEQLANGIMPAYAPLAKDDYMIILDSNCLWLRGLRNYLMYSGDEKTVLELLPAAQKLIELLHRFTSDLHFIDNPPYAYWLDHAQNDRRGANLCLNGHYLGALCDYAEILRYFKRDTKEIDFQIDAAKLSFIHFWDEEKQLFADAVIDGKPSPMFSEQGNAMALQTNNVWKEEASLASRKLLADEKHNYIQRESGLTMVTPAMSYFLHKGLCEQGFVKESFELFRKRFDKMLVSGTNKTLWEEWWLDGSGRTGKFQGGRTRSDAQTESAFTPALFAEFLVGITPTQPGAKEWALKNIDSGVKQLRASIPSVLGNIEIEWDRGKTKKLLTVSVPENMVVKVDLQSLKKEDGTVVRCNNKVINGSDRWLPLKTGKYKISF